MAILTSRVATTVDEAVSLADDLIGKLAATEKPAATENPSVLTQLSHLLECMSSQDPRYRQAMLNLAKHYKYGEAIEFLSHAINH